MDLFAHERLIVQIALIHPFFEDVFSKAVSTIRQPIESFFNWINEKTQIQKGSKIRSSKGLIIHIFGKLSALAF